MNNQFIVDLEQRIKQLEIELQTVLALLQIQAVLQHKDQDAEVCRYFEEGCESPDSTRVPGTSLEKAPSPRGDWRWPPRSQGAERQIKPECHVTLIREAQSGQ